MVEAHGLTRRYGRLVAVDALSFAVPRGSVVGLLGPNGAGKTTTIRMLVGFLPPTSGRVVLDGIDLAQAPREARRRVGYLPESNPLHPELRVEELLTFRARLHAIPRRARGAAIEESLRRCHLLEVRRRLVGELSKGYRQRVGLAAAILHDPPVLVLDEPTSGFDPAQVQEFRALIRELAGRHTVIVSSHILPEIEAICERVLMISGGRLVADGPLAELRRRRSSRRQIAVETPTDCAAMLASIPGVASARSAPLPDGWHRTTVLTEAGAEDLRERIARRLEGAGLLVRELSRREPTLEELFLELAAPEGARTLDRSAPHPRPPALARTPGTTAA